MDIEKLNKKLISLAQLDIDAVHAYREALKQIDDTEIHAEIDKFCNDHIRHIENLNKLIIKYEGEPPKMTQDFKGYVIQGFTSLRSITGTLGALKAMETNEILTNKNYRDAIETHDDTNEPEDVKNLLLDHYSDEQHHLEYIRSMIDILENEE